MRSEATATKRSRPEDQVSRRSGAPLQRVGTVVRQTTASLLEDGWLGAMASSELLRARDVNGCYPDSAADVDVFPPFSPSHVQMSVSVGITACMALHWKLVIDTSDAPTLADFWAAALGYEVEDQSVLIDRLLAAGQLDDSVVTEHRGRRTFRGFAAIRHPDDPFDRDTGVGQGRRVLFQDVPEPKTVKNRLHIDVHAGAEGLAALVERLESLGATRIREFDKGPAGHWWVMRDPEGNEFCAAQ